MVLYFDVYKPFLCVGSSASRSCSIGACHLCDSYSEPHQISSQTYTTRGKSFLFFSEYIDCFASAGFRENHRANSQLQGFSKRGEYFSGQYIHIMKYMEC